MNFSHCIFKCEKMLIDTYFFIITFWLSKPKNIRIKKKLFKIIFYCWLLFTCYFKKIILVYYVNLKNSVIYNNIKSSLNIKFTIGGGNLYPELILSRTCNFKNTKNTITNAEVQFLKITYKSSQFYSYLQKIRVNKRN